ncbi:MAG: PaaI family thioesterase [Nitrospiraceae bacterium]|nr:PaaI family thioesterase [Nitrospiraceae bacterium]
MPGSQQQERPTIQVPPACDLTLGMECVDKSTPGVSVWRMWAHERFANPAGVMQGGFIAAFVDSSMGAATITYAGRKVISSNTNLSLSFLRAALIGSELVCTARVVSGGQAILFVEAEVVDDAGRLVAKGQSTYYLRPR